jgi:hypothetical protein
MSEHTCKTGEQDATRRKMHKQASAACTTQATSCERYQYVLWPPQLFARCHPRWLLGHRWDVRPGRPVLAGRGAHSLFAMLLVERVVEGGDRGFHQRHMADLHPVWRLVGHCGVLDVTWAWPEGALLAGAVRGDEVGGGLEEVCVFKKEKTTMTRRGVAWRWELWSRAARYTHTHTHTNALTHGTNRSLDTLAHDSSLTFR